MGDINASYVKNANGVLMIAIHFAAIYFVFTSVSARLDPKDQISVIMILAPLTAAFVTMFLKDLVKTAPAGSPEPTPYKSGFSAITILLTILYGVTVFFILNHYLNNPDVGADMLKLYIGLIETIIGGFVGILYGELYK